MDIKQIKKISREYGNSFYLLDTDRFIQNYRDLIASFMKYYENTNIAYSYKTNYIPKLVQIVDQMGGFAEVVSEMELEIALRSKVKPEKIIWNGPVKNAQKVEELLLAGGTVNLDSIHEIVTIQDIAIRNPDYRLNIGLRCNYDIGDGVISRFGFDVDGEEFNTVLKCIKDIANLHLVNLQVHYAKRAPEYWTARAEGLLKTYDKVVEKYGLKPERLDIGGGIYGRMPENLAKQLGIGKIAFDDYASKAAKLFAEHFNNFPDKPWLFIEPGSALAGDCMRFICRIESIKDIRGKKIATVIGSQKNISMTGINPPLEVIPGGQERQKYKNIDIVGFTCIEGDVLQKNYCGELGVGDYIVISNCGSYSLVMKPPFILPNFPVIDISSGSINLIKRAENFDDLFHTYQF